MKKKSFLEFNNYKQNKRFNAFNVINAMLFIAILSLFIFSMCFCIRDMVEGKTDRDYTIFLIMHLLVIVIIFLPLLAKKILRIQIPYFATSLFYFFLFLTSYLGTFRNLYQIIPFWDNIVHFISGILFGFLAVFFLNIVYKKQQKSNALFVFLFVFAFALSIGVIWEIYEFTCDCLLGLNLQRYLDPNGIAYIGHDAVVDTMLDLVMDFGGALFIGIVCSIWSHFDKNFISYFTIKKTKKKKKEISQIEE